MERDLDIANLRSFLMIAETGSATRAAGRRNLTQSAVSQQLRKLEAQLGVSLFERTGKALRLSAQGAEFLGHARKIIEANDRSVSIMTGTEFEETISLGVPHDLVTSMLPEPLEQFHLANPHVRVILVDGSSRDLMEGMRNGQLDIVLTTDTKPSGSAQLLRSAPLVWVGKVNGSAYLKRPLPVALGPTGCPFRAAATAALDAEGIPWRAITQVGSLQPVFATLLADMAVSPFLKGTSPSGICETTDGLPLLAPFYIHVRTRILSIASQSLMDFISRSLKAKAALSISSD